MAYVAFFIDIVYISSPLKHTFSVVRSAGSSDYNYVNPVRRDVVALGNSGDNVTIRWVTDNPGPWFLHWYIHFVSLQIANALILLYSHIDWHLEAGLAIVFAEDTANIAAHDSVSSESLLSSSESPFEHD